MTAKIVGLYRDQENCELVRYYAGARDPVELYRKTVWYKVHPRNFEYMRACSCGQSIPILSRANVTFSEETHCSVLSAI